MNKKYFAVVLLAVFASAAAPVRAEAKSGEKENLLDIISEPFRVILRPVGAEGLADTIFRPVEDTVYPVSSFGEPVTTPGRTEEHIYNINGNVDVITGRDIADMNARTVQDALAGRAGIVYNGYFNNTKDSNLDIRGFGSAGNLNYLVMVDGRRVNQTDLSGPDLAQVDIRSVDRIEIVRGPGTVLYGDNATGGVINIITKRGGPGSHAEYTQEFGSYRYNKEYFSFDGGQEFLDYFFSASWQDSDGYRLNNGYEASDMFASLTVRPSGNLSVRFSSGYHRDWYGQAGALYDGNLQSDGRTGSRFPDSKAKTEDYYCAVEPKALAETDGADIAFSAPFTYRLRRSNALDVGFNRYETNHHIASFDLRPKCEVTSFHFDESVRNKLVFGMDYFRAEDRVLSGDIAFTKSQADIEKETLAFYAEDNMLINDRFTLSGGIRGEWAEYRFDQIRPASSIDEKSLREIAFDAGAGFKYNERSQVYASYARSYRLPATDEYFQSAYEAFDWWTFTVRVFPATLNFDLKQQVGNNFEIGVKDNTFEPLRVRADYYFIDNKNEIYYDPASFTNENYHQTFHHGLEAEAGLDVCGEVRVFANYTFQQAVFKGGKYGGYVIPLVPEHMVKGGVRVEPLDSLVIGLEVNYTGEMVIANDPRYDSSPLEARTTVDLSVSYETGGVRLFFAARNLLGARYFSNATRNWQGNTAFYPAPGRSFEGGATVRF